ncbi:MAG: hypothetical protein RBT59_06275 [Arcobacteraceae bacterium]|jgi:hypothetical protein|nr:hypothetical protein [Arcobacteraceae bacterium]
MNMVDNNNKNIFVDGYVDSITLRIDFIDKDYRAAVFSELCNFVKEKKIVAVKYDEEKSTQYRQITNLLSSNTTIATISRSAYTYANQNLLSNIQQYYIAISFFGLKRYSKRIDEKSFLLLQNIVAYLNTNNIPYCLTQFDISADVPCHTNSLLAVCLKRKLKTQYHPLGQYDEYSKNIQTNNGTYEIERFESTKKQNNVMKRAYLYDKRKKEIEKANNDLGYELSRFEVSFQNRFFLHNEVSVNSFLQEIKDYNLFYFEDIKKKEKFVKQYNKANSNKHRTQLTDKISQSTPTVKIKMFKIGEFLKMLDLITFDSNGRLVIGSDKYYIYGLSKFNRNKKF